MNLKKGLTRLFVFGLTISAIVGFVMVDKKSLSNTNIFYIEQISRIKKEITYPECQGLLKLTNKDNLPTGIDYNGPCESVVLFWDDIKERQIKTKTQDIDARFVQDTLSAKSSSYYWGELLGMMLLYAIGYVLVCFLAWLIFIALRWVKRGFSF